MFLKLFLCVVLLQIAYGQNTIENFILFDASNGDATMPRPLDSVTGPISINVRFPFFGKWYNVIRVYSHGLILFGNVTYALPHNPPGPFPLKDFVCAAPYWADTDLTKDSFSNIFYREILDESTLTQISSMIKNGYPLLSASRVLWAFVVTWYRVAGHTGDPGRNTFQAIIATNGIYSFTIFTYNQIQWAAGAWGGYPQVGFNAGDQLNYFTVEDSFSADIVHITQQSNVGIPGQFIFLTNGNISKVECNTTQGLQSSPFRGSMHGGYQFRLFGVCFPDKRYIVEVNGQPLDDCQVTSVFITCTMPMVSEGRLQIEVLRSDRQSIGHTDFLSFMPEMNGDVILFNHGDLINKPRTIQDRRFDLQFLKNNLTTHNLFRLVIYDYSTQYIASSNEFYNLSTQRIDLPLGLLNLSSLNNLTVNFQSIFPITGVPADQVHLLDFSFELIRPNTTTTEAYTWKGAQKFITRTFIVPYAMLTSYCSTWVTLQSDAITRNVTSRVPSCPCRVLNTWADEQFGFSADPVCHGRKSGPWNCQYNKPRGRACYRRKSLNSDGGAHCCYDTAGILISDIRQGSGSVKAHFPDTMKALSTYQHFFTDFLPYFSCCGIATEVLATCSQYTKYRPAGSCVNLLPIPPTGGRGDPHFSTLNGKSYTFNGHGEYTLVKSSDNTFHVQVRLARLTNETTSSMSASSSMDSATAIVAFVIHNDDQPRVQFELLPALKSMEIHVNGKLIEFTPLTSEEELQSSSLIYADDRQLVIRQRDINSYSISYGESEIQFIAHVRPQYDFLDLSSIIPKTFKQNSVFQGILGGFTGLTYSNGTNVSASFNDDRALFDYGESWRTTNESSLFYYRLQDSHAEHQDLTYRPMFQEDLFEKYASTERYRLAAEACRNLTHEQQCIYDILITNDVTIVQMQEKYEAEVHVLDDYVELVTTDIENDAKTTTTMESPLTQKPLNSGMRFSINSIWMIVFMALLA
ncbi:unnamed protein product [Adineta ricciae]|uniref:Uncharacterized protein n=3 Tax=Adineta ricciae TaxID=249248 RepID=A0A815QDL4_ADIRI|nr:unnamed protein product [Adineta ricciae]